MKRRTCLLVRRLSLLALAGIAPAQAVEPLRASANTSWGMPFGRYENERLVEGIVFDLHQAIGEQLRAPVVNVSLPRKRIDGAALAGDIDMRCYLHPSWTETPDIYEWSEPLFELADALVGGADTPRPRRLGDLPAGALVGAVLGYRYPSLDEAFARGRLKRDDAIDQEKLLLKVSAGRTPYGLGNVVAIDWYRRTTPQHRLADWRLVVATTPIHCAIAKSSPWAGGKALRALHQLKQSGRIAAILRKYR